MVTIQYAEKGKVWKSLKEGWVGSNVLILGINDNINNYEQIDEPIPEEEEVPLE